MSRPDEDREPPRQQSLFGTGDSPRSTRVRSWPPIPAESEPHPTADRAGLERLDALLLQLLQRNRRFLRALERHATDALEKPAVESFRDLETVLLGNLALLRLGKVEAIEVPEVTREAWKCVAELAKARAEVLGNLPAEVAERVVTAEPRMRAKEIDLLPEIAAAQFQLGEDADFVELAWEPLGADEPRDEAPPEGADEPPEGAEPPAKPAPPREGA